MLLPRALTAEHVGETERADLTATGYGGQAAAGYSRNTDGMPNGERPAGLTAHELFPSTLTHARDPAPYTADVRRH